MESGGDRARGRRYAAYQEGRLEETSERGRIWSSGSARGRGKAWNYNTLQHYGNGEQKSGNRGRLSTDGKTKLTGIPQEYMGLIIGKHGAMLDEISRETGAVLERINREVYMSGSPEAQRRVREKIDEIINNSSTRRFLPTGNSSKLSSVPNQCMGAVIGTRGSKLRSIEVETETKLRVKGKDINISGSSQNQRKARVKIKKIISDKLVLQKGAIPTKFQYVDTSCLPEDAVFTLQPVPPPYSYSAMRSFYRLKLEEETLFERNTDPEATFAGLKEKLLDTLRNLHRERDEQGLQVEMWCHFARVYLYGIDEAIDKDFFTVADIESHIRPSSSDKPMWSTDFRDGITKIELRELEAVLREKACSSTEVIQQDFCILTPTYRTVRAKVWLVKEKVDSAAAVGSKYSFLQSPPVLVRNQLQRVLSEKNGDPSFFLCAPFKRRLLVDIILPGYRFDCRLIIRSSERDASDNQKPHEKEDEIIKDYLSQMRITEKGIVELPPEIENFEISFNRRSLRRTYRDDSVGLPCNITVCRMEDATDKESDPYEFVDIYLHCDEWDQSLQEDNWEPEQIVERLPQFLQFVTNVQRNLKLLDQFDARDEI